MQLCSFNTYLSEARIAKTKLAYHKTLNPKLWEQDGSEYILIPKVSERLKEIANIFIKNIDINRSFITDIVFTGSSTNFNYSELSDVDIHINVDFSKLKGKIDPADYFNALKTNWNNTHNITIYGHDVELYISDSKENLVGNAAAYSLKYDKWIQEPKLTTPDYKPGHIKSKANHLAMQIDRAIKYHHDNKAELEKISSKINKMRRAGLAKHGEFSLENLVFKTLRNNGYIEKLRKQINKAEDSQLNLESMV